MPCRFPCEFWWNWWVQVAVAIGTLLAALVALFVAIAGHRMRHWLFPPALTVDIDRVEGVAAVTGEPGGPPARWYHVVVRNEARWSNAHSVRVLLLQVEEPGPNGALVVTWTGELPLMWEHQELYPVTRTVGAPAKADLIAVYQSRVLELRTMITAFNLPRVRRDNCALTLTLQARSDEGDSPAFRLRVSWDGNFDAGEQEMRRHLVLEPLQ
jgi:hypothetical protein